MNPKTDRKNVELRRLVGHLRDHIDVHRIIGINHNALKASAISNVLLGHVQRSALESAALILCKIYESSARNDLNSIPGIIESLPSTLLDERQKSEFSSFGSKHGNDSRPTDARDFLKETLRLFCGTHSSSLEQFKEFRDKIGAHSEFNATLEAVGSHDDLETFFDFANDFYRLVSHSIHGVEAASVESRVGRGLVRLIESMGIADPRFDFERDAARP